jgi:hypothetical protein
MRKQELLAGSARFPVGYDDKVQLKQRNFKDLVARSAFGVARSLLMSGPNATPPRFRAIQKLATLLKAHPEIAMLPAHKRGSHRSWPRIRRD